MLIKAPLTQNTPSLGNYNFSFYLTSEAFAKTVSKLEVILKTELSSLLKEEEEGSGEPRRRTMDAWVQNSADPQVFS